MDVCHGTNGVLCYRKNFCGCRRTQAPCQCCQGKYQPVLFSLKYQKKMNQAHHIPSVFQATIYTGNVLALYVSKPRGFKYKSGMYIFVKCPDISTFEW